MRRQPDFYRFFSFVVLGNVPTLLIDGDVWRHFISSSLLLAHVIYSFVFCVYTFSHYQEKNNFLLNQPTYKFKFFSLIIVLRKQDSQQLNNNSLCECVLKK